MNANAYQKYIVTKFVNPDVTGTVLDRPTEELDILLNLLNATSGLAGESGETLDLVKKVVFHGHPFDDTIRAKMLKELGDIGFYFAWACYVMGTNIEYVLAMNAQKLDTRYPKGFNTEDSIKRRDVANG
jgi:NTP pyrophosphatase (non-canonical NTP hydrolase)